MGGGGGGCVVWGSGAGGRRAGGARPPPPPPPRRERERQREKERSQNSRCSIGRAHERSRQLPDYQQQQEPHKAESRRLSATKSAQLGTGKRAGGRRGTRTQGNAYRRSSISDQRCSPAFPSASSCTARRRTHHSGCSLCPSTVQLRAHQQVDKRRGQKHTRRSCVEQPQHARVARGHEKRERRADQTSREDRDHGRHTEHHARGHHTPPARDAWARRGLTRPGRSRRAGSLDTDCAARPVDPTDGGRGGGGARRAEGQGAGRLVAGL